MNWIMNIFVEILVPILLVLLISSLCFVGVMVPYYYFTSVSIASGKVTDKYITAATTETHLNPVVVGQNTGVYSSNEYVPARYILIINDGKALGRLSVNIDDYSATHVGEFYQCKDIRSCEAMDRRIR